MSTENIEFLGSSQTFTGVLCTLVVLCMMLERSNFIHNILLNISKDIKDIIRRSTDFKAQEIKDTPEYIEFKDLKSRLEKRDPAANINAEAFTLDLKILSRFNQNVSDRLSNITISTNHFIDQEKKSKEQILGPYIAFSFCIVMFLLDELCALGLVKLSSASTFLFYMVILCSLLLVSNWVFYGRRIFLRLLNIQDNQHGMSIRMRKGKIKFAPDAVMMVEIVIGLSLLYFYSGTVVLALRSPEFRLYTDLVLSFIAVLWPIAVVSYHHRSHFPRYISYSDIYPISHFIFILLSVTIIIGGVFLTNFIWDFDLKLIIPDQRSIIFLSEMFVLVFGLCLPLLLPYLSFQQVHDIATHKAASIIKNHTRNLNEQLEELREFNARAKVVLGVEG